MPEDFFACLLSRQGKKYLGPSVYFLHIPDSTTKKGIACTVGSVAWVSFFLPSLFLVRTQQYIELSLLSSLLAFLPSSLFLFVEFR